MLNDNNNNNNNKSTAFTIDNLKLSRQKYLLLVLRLFLTNFNNAFSFNYFHLKLELSFCLLMKYTLLCFQGALRTRPSSFQTVNIFSLLHCKTTTKKSLPML